MSLDSLCRWQAQVSVYCTWRIPAHLRCTQCSILLHLIDICFLTFICLWQISQIQTRLFKVVGPGLVSTSPAFVSSSASHLTQFTQQLVSAVTAPPLVGCVVWSHIFYVCCCLPTPMTLASGGSPMFPLVVHQPASPSIWPAVQPSGGVCPQIQG